MWTNLRIAGGVLFGIALFLKPLRFSGHHDSAFQWAAHRDSFEAIAVFVASMAMAVTAAISTFLTRRVVDWLEMLLTLLALCGIVFFVARFGEIGRGVCLSWPGLMIVGGLAMIALGAHGRYRNAGRE